MMNTRDFSHLCRLCLVKDNVNVPIFENNDEGGKSVYSMICSCLPVKLSEVDNLPKKICSSCIEKLNSFYEFRKISSDSEKQLIQWLQELELEPEKSEQDFDNSPEPKLENVDSTYVKNDNNSNTTGVLSTLLNQPEFQENFTLDHSQDSNGEPSIKKLKSNATSSESDDEDNVQTKLESDSNESDAAADQDQDADCGTDSGQLAADNNQPGPSGLGKSSDETPLNHLVSIKQELTEDDSYDSEMQHDEELRNNEISCFKSEDENESKKSVKKKKKRQTKNMFYISEHIENSLNEPVQCEDCEQTYPSNVKYALHSIEHNQDGKYSCHFCDYRNASKYHIVLHIKAHEGTTKYKCEICNKAFTVSTHAAEHKYFHTGEKPFQCEICGKHFMFSWFLTSHRRTQHWEIMTGTPLVKYDCTICNKHYTSSTGLKRHKQSKHNESGVYESVLCDMCGKQLSSLEKLKFHRRIHTGYKPFICQICKKSFTKKEQLKEHERVHTGERPYLCRFCGKGFTQRSPLRIHERIHTGERPYVCKVCNRGFISKGVMDTHMKSCAGPIIMLD